MKQGVAFLCLVVVGAPAEAHDVTSAAARRRTLLEYVAARTDLSRAEKGEWERALRSTFGGKAIKDGTDEGVTAAKSVISAAIFHQVPASTGARAAYDAYHDIYRWIPPPIAINYQVLGFQGRKPAATARELAYRFPRHFSEELAPELVAWWHRMLEEGKISELEVADVRTALRQTRDLMRPMLLEKLWRAAEFQSRQRAWKEAGGREEYRARAAEAMAELERMRQELGESFVQVAHSPVANDARASFYDRYRAVAVELGKKPRPAPRFALPPTVTPLPTTPPARVQPQPRPPRAKPAQGAQGAEDKPDRRQVASGPQGPGSRPKPSARAERMPSKRHRGRYDRPGTRQAPFPGDPLVPIHDGWVTDLRRTADGWAGTPYRLGGVARRGIDCSAFTRAVFRETLDLELPRNSRAQYRTGTGVRQNRLEPGDLIFFDTLDRGRVTHVGVYLGDGQFSHASSSKGVTRAVLKKAYYQRAFVGIRRVVSSEPALDATRSVAAARARQ